MIEQENVIRIMYHGYHKKEGRFALCVLLVRETEFSVNHIYSISEQEEYPICSDIRVDRLIKDTCLEGPQDIIDAINQTLESGHFFIHSPDYGSVDKNPFAVPRLGEADFQQIVEQMGGNKIQETTTKTPDFAIGKVLLELKDIQSDSLFNKERQVAVGEIFKDEAGYSIDLDPNLDFGDLTADYHRLIANTIKNHVKKASDQMKVYSQGKDIESAGLILMNTGMYSLPHDLLISIVTNIIENQTKTIKFAFVVTQRMQANGLDLYLNLFQDLVGIAPPNLENFRVNTGEHVNQRMTDMMRGVTISNTVESQHPISFVQHNKVFYWNPGRVTGDLTKAFERKE